MYDMLVVLHIIIIVIAIVGQAEWHANSRVAVLSRRRPFISRSEIRNRRREAKICTQFTNSYTCGAHTIF